jgi:hypothetical protein
MKKMMSAFFLLLVAGASTVFANGEPEPGQVVLNEFKKEFSTAQNVSWTRQDEFDKATFVLAGRRVIAYFNSLGQLEGCVREIFFDQLPLAVMTAVDKRFSNAEILDVNEITNGEGTTYRVRLSLKDRKYRVKISANGNISDVEKIK